MTQEKDKRIVNLRFLFCCFVGIMLGILSSTFLLLGKLAVILFVLFILLVLGIVVGVILYSIKLKKTYNNTRFKKNVPNLLKWSSIGFGVTFVIGILIVIYPIINVIKIPIYNEKVVVTGVVCDYVDKEDTYTQFLIKDCKVIAEESIESIDMKIVVNTSIYSDIKLGDYVTFESELQPYNVSDEFGLSRLAQGIGYSTYASTSNLATTSGEVELKDLVHSKVKNILDNNLNNGFGRFSTSPPCS